eukprot:TRINITY_DN24_c0_g1_i2.p1 TRINITY_DN24_c0_g1~~TRINITY_DN24_c0_g1_i2.p1  ORF type:complete len:1287 (+),score=393.58 TRINITY_DN24_c0_g1_i2:378-3863(+)
MDGSDGACPSLTDLVGNDGLWAADLVHSFSGGSDWLSRLGGCSWMPRAAKKLSFNRGNLTNAQFPHAQNTVQASPLDDWLICSCPEGGYPKYVSVVAGQTCPDHERESFLGQQPTCAPLTAEGNCEEAAAMMGLPDQSLEMCIANCSDANVSAHETDAAVNTAEVGPHRPPGCHYRFHPDIADDHLWFNPHGDSSTAYAKPPGEGVAPDYLICGCGDVAPLLAMGGCQFVGNTGKSRSCGHGQTCQALPTGGFRCTCDYPIGSPATAENEPAQCTESVPKKIISWVSGSECPYDEDTQCLPPPTKERCEEALAELGLFDSDGKASLPHSAAERNAPYGCHYVHGDESPLRWNPQPSGSDTGASPARSLICECKAYPMFVPKLGGVGCGSAAGSCRPIESKFECALAADLIEVPVPTAYMQDNWNTTMCIVDPDAGAGSPWIPCGSKATADCTAPGADVRLCKWTVGGGGMLIAQPTGQQLDFCHHHAASNHTGSPLWWHGSGFGDASIPNTPDDFRICDCADESKHEVIAPRLGFALVGDGDCAAGPSPTPCQPDDHNCVVKGGVPLLRAERYNCSALPSMMACHADTGVCKWNATTNSCGWKEANFANEGEIPAIFSDCLEHCLLLCHCTGVSFFTPLNASLGSLGGCDFFTGPITDSTGESVREGKGQGDWQCWRNVPENPIATPAPTWECPRCERIPNQFECRNTFGCAWSSADYCCCDPFISSCTHAWHTTTSTEATCEAQDDNGRQCRWVGPNATTGFCELPLSQCVDEYVDLQLSGSMPADENQFCVDLFNAMQALGLQGIAAGCGSCNVSSAGVGIVGVSMAIDLVGDRTCGQATRMANKHSNFINQQTPAAMLLGRVVVSHSLRSKCWEDCAKNPKCAKPPTVAPTPYRLTLPPSPGLQQGFPSASPTASPNACPVTLTSSSTAPFECECGKFKCEESQPWLNSDYNFCGKCPPEFDNAVYFKCPRCTGSDTQINITCPQNYETCEIFVLVHHEPRCNRDSNGGWTGNLDPADGWIPSSCAPAFCGNNTCQTNDTFRMLSLRKQILGGDVEELPGTMTDPTYYFTVLVVEGKVCGAATTPETCEDGIGLCKWKGAAGCVSEYCPGVVPPPGIPPPLPPPGTYPTPRFPNIQPTPPPEPLCCAEGVLDGTCVVQ